MLTNKLDVCFGLQACSVLREKIFWGVFLEEKCSWRNHNGIV